VGNFDEHNWGTSPSVDNVSRLPHDLCHLVVEQGLDIVYGFWGLVSRGVDVRLRDGHAELALERAPLRDHPNVDFSDLRRSEEAVAVLSPSGLRTDTSGPLVIVTIGTAADAGPLTDTDVERIQELFPSTSAEKLRSVRDQLVALEQRWQETDAGQSLTFTFRPPPSSHTRNGEDSTPVE